MFDVIVIGGGAAGIFAALAAKQSHPEFSVHVLEKTAVLLSKVKVSGGGRCNVTHSCFDPKLLVKNYPRGEKELLGPFHRFQPRDTIEWFESRGVKLKTESDGRMFPITDSSTTIIECLLSEARKLGVEIRLRQRVEKIEKGGSCKIAVPQKIDDFAASSQGQQAGPCRADETMPEWAGEIARRELAPKGRFYGAQQFCNCLQWFTLHLKDNPPLTCKYLILASGSSPEGYANAESLGHTIAPPVPSLFTFNVPTSPLKELSGISVDLATVEVGPFTQTGPLLMTHFGFSGPAILKLSAWGARFLHEKNYRTPFFINWIPKLSQEELFKKLLQLKEESPQKTLLALNPFYFPKNLWKELLASDKTLANLSKKELQDLAQKLHADTYQMDGKTTHKEEFVTCGGVVLKEVDFKTLQSKICPGLYFAGEILNIDGVTGGFNFQNAWTTGFIAGKSI